MAHLDTSPLTGWPTSQSVKDSAQAILNKGDAYKTVMTNSRADWKDLGGPKVLEGSFSNRLSECLDCLSGIGDHLHDGARAAGVALDELSAWLENNEKDRKDVLAAADAYNNLPEPPEDPPQNPSVPSSSPSGEQPSTSNSPHLQYVQQGQLIQDQIDSLKDGLDDAVSLCVTHLDSIESDGATSNPTLRTLILDSAGVGLPGIQAILVNTYKQTTTTVTRYTVRLFGKDFDVPLLRSKKVDAKIKISDWITHPTFKERLMSALKDPFGLKGSDVPKAEMPPKYAENPATGKFGVGTKTTETVANDVSKLRWLGRGAFVAGAALSMYAEGDTAYEKAQTEHPEWTESQKLSTATEAGVVRGGSQVVAAAVAGAAIGSVVPVGGTAVGLVIGVAVGAAMMIPTGGGKSVGDRVADGGQWVWNHLGASNLWHSVWH